MTACLGDETIAAMLEGALPAEHARLAREHLASCDACRRLVSAAVDAPSETLSPHSIPPTVRDVLIPGAMIDGKYRIERALGEGGMGRVMVARQIGLERPVALKVLRPELAKDPQALHRFKREARLVASLVGESVVRVHDLGELPGGEPYLVMELLEGEDLATIVQRGPLPIEQAVSFLLAACEALAEAHAIGMVHRDIKPSNLFVTRNGRLKVLDFGLAKLFAPLMTSTNMTGSGQILGSPRYMAPEQILGARDVDARADIWSLGATLYHLVTGVPPFPESELSGVFARILEGRLPPLDRIRPDVATVIQRCLARDPRARFQDVREVSLALARPSPPNLSMPVPPPLPPKRSNAGLFAALAVFIGLVVVGGVAASVYVVRAFSQKVAQVTADPGESKSVGTGSLSPLDETRLVSRLKVNGWTVFLTKVIDTGTCEMTLMQISGEAGAGFTVTYEECSFAGAAIAEEKRLQSPTGWAIRDGKRLLTVGIDSEKTSRELAEKLAAPP